MIKRLKQKLFSDYRRSFLMGKRGCWAGILCLGLMLIAMTVMSSTAKAASDSIVLKYGSWMPERHVTSEQTRWWAEQVTKKTGGRVQFKFFYSQALGTAKDQPDNIKYGTFEFGPTIPSYDPAKMPLWTITFTPWVSSVDPWVRFMALRDLAELPEMKEQLEKWDAMFLFPTAMADVYYLWTAKKPVHTLGDIKGLKLRAEGQMENSILGVGATPVAMPMPDFVEALSKGIIDGGVISTASALAYKLQEVCKYKSTIRLGAGGPTWIMKKSVFTKLPPDIQKAIMEVSLDMGNFMAQMEVDVLKKADETFKKAGVNIIDFPKEDQLKLEEVAVMPVVEKWIKDQENRGFQGKKAWETFRNATLKYEKTPHPKIP